jgi:pyrimidine deaminase RibD-like protein
MAGVNVVPVKILDPKDVKYTDIVDPTLARTTNEDQSDYEIHNYHKLDGILHKLCQMVVKGQQSDKDYGMVAAAVLDPDNQIIARLNRPGTGDKRIHAEHAAMLDYTEKYGDIPEGSIILTTLSPCNEHMDERDGPSCTDIINQAGVKKVYCGYIDPSQHNEHRDYNLMETSNLGLRNTCKQFADTFLDEDDIEEGLMGFLTKPTKVVNKPKVSAEEMRKYFEKEKAKDPEKIERGELNKQAQQVYTKRDENFADGKHPEDKGDSKRYHVPTKGSVSSLRKFAKGHHGRAAQLAHWMANMKAGHKK